MLIEVQGQVNEHGEVEIHWPADLPPGKIRVVIESYDPDLEAAEDAKRRLRLRNLSLCYPS